MTRFCPNCGTEVDDNAVFCPTCGQPIDQDVEAEMPPAPSWPEPESRATAAAPPPPEPGEREPVGRAVEESPLRDGAGWVAEPPHQPEPEPEPDSELTRVVDPQPEPAPMAAQRPAHEAPPARANVPPPPPPAPAKPAVDVPLTMPVTLSGWLIGGGAALGAIGALIALFDGLGTAVDVVLLVGLLLVAASVFLSDRVPNVPQLRLITLSVVLVGFGVTLDRLGFGRAGAGDLLLFLGTAAAAIGAIILETGRDQPLGGPSA